MFATSWLNESLKKLVKWLKSNLLSLPFFPRTDPKPKNWNCQTVSWYIDFGSRSRLLDFYHWIRPNVAVLGREVHGQRRLIIVSFCFFSHSLTSFSVFFDAACSLDLAAANECTIDWIQVRRNVRKSKHPHTATVIAQHQMKQNFACFYRRLAFARVKGGWLRMRKPMEMKKNTQTHRLTEKDGETKRVRKSAVKIHSQTHANQAHTEQSLMGKKI